MTDPATTPSPRGFAAWFPRVLAIVLALHFARGALPFSPVEGDEQGVINGVQSWMRGTPDFDSASYLYPMQPGSYHVIRWGQQLTGATPLQVFGALSTASAAAFLGCASLLLARVTNVRPAWTAVLLLTLQEFTAAACYPSTNALAAGSVLGGLLLAQRARSRTGILVAGALLGLGGWLRFDSLLITPAFLPLRLMTVKPARAVADTALAAGASLLVIVLACASIGLPFRAISSALASRAGVAADWQMLSVNGWLVLGYVASVGCLLGTLRLVLLRRWLPLGLVVAGGMLTLAVYAPTFTSPKYLYYAAPFLALPGLLWLAEALAQPSSRRFARTAALAVIGLHVTECTAGLQTSSPAFRRFDPAVPLVGLVQVTVGTKSIGAGLGEAEILPTADGPRLRGGQAWAPAMWRREKNAMLEEIARLDGEMQAGDVDVVVTSTYLSVRLLENWLRDHGFAAQPRRPLPGNDSSYLEEWRNGERHLTVAQVNHTPSDAVEFAAACRLPGRVLVVNDRGRNAFLHLAGDRDAWQLLSPSENRLITLYRPRKQADAPR